MDSIISIEKIAHSYEESVNKEILKILEYYSEELISGLDKTKSPVERMYLVWINYEQIYYDLGNDVFVNVVPQYKVIKGEKTFYTDFCFEVIDYYPVSSPLLKLFVEIDGHDFHEKTKEQVKLDKQRERELADVCDALLRFSGSEIFNDPRGCVRETIRILRKKFNDKYPEGI